MSDLDPPSWLADPTGRHQHRFWDGAGWTDHVADDGEAAVDPYRPGAPTSSAPPVVPAPWTTSAPPPPAPEDAQLTWRSGSSPVRPATPAEPTPTPEPEPAATRPPVREPDWEPQWDEPEPAAPAPARTEAPRTEGAEPSRLTGWATPDDIIDALAPQAPDPTPVAAEPPAPEPAAPAPDPTPVPSAPAPVAAPVSTAPPPPASSPSGGDGPGPKPGRRRLVLVLVALLVLVGVGVGIAVAGGGDDERSRQAGYVRALLQGRIGEMSDDDISCLADAVVDDLGVDGTKALHLEDIDEDSTSFPEELLASLQTATSTCAATLEDDDADDGSTDSGPSGTTATSEPLSVDEQARIYMDEYDLSAIQAQCLAEANAEVRDAETLTRDEIIQRIRDCDVDPAVLGVVESTTTTATAG